MYDRPERRVEWWIVGGMKGGGADGVLEASIASSFGVVWLSSAIVRVDCGVDCGVMKINDNLVEVAVIVGDAFWQGCDASGQG